MKAEGRLPVEQPINVKFQNKSDQNFHPIRSKLKVLIKASGNEILSN